MKNAQNDETTEIRKTCCGYKIQVQVKEDKLKNIPEMRVLKS
jgi:hypothetical protein